MDRLSLSTQRKPRFSDKIFSIHLLLLLPVCLIVAFGVVTLYSAAGGNMEPWANKQLIRFILGMIILLVVASIDLQFWLRYSYVIYAICLLLLITVEIKGYIGMGAQRWIDLKFIRMQPSELMKIGIILALARFFHFTPTSELNNPFSLLQPIMIVIVPSGLVLLQPDMGTAGLFLIVGSLIFLVSAIARWIIITVFISGCTALPILWRFMHGYQKRRIYAFLDPENDPLGAGYHAIQSKIALGSGGIWGKGFLQGSQSHLNFLPEKQTDFIFAMFCEEFGFIAGIILIAMYMIFIAAGYYISRQSHNYFGKIISFGIVAMTFCYMAINIAMVAGVFPVVGVPLPLMSYGGTSMLTMLIGCGLLMSTSIHKNQRLHTALSDE